MFVYFALFAFFSQQCCQKLSVSVHYIFGRVVFYCVWKGQKVSTNLSLALWFRSHKGLQTSQHNLISVLNGNVNAYWNSLIIQPLSSRDSVLCWCYKSWTHIASLKTKSCTRSYLTQATDTHPSLATGTVARRPIHRRLVQCCVEPESDSPAVQLTFVRCWMEIQLQLEHRLHVSNVQLTVSRLNINVSCFLLWRDSEQSMALEAASTQFYTIWIKTESLPFPFLWFLFLNFNALLSSMVYFTWTRGATILR